LDIIFLQETLVDSKKARLFLNRFLSNWHICTVSSLGNSGGLVVAWDPTKFDLSPFLCCGGMLLSGTFLFNNKRIHFLNIYGPCTDRQTFWNKVEARGLLDLENLIIAGDLNLTTSVREIWGDSATQDTLEDYFISLFSSHNLVDYAPVILAPTWRNGRLGSDSISKRLDRFLISDQLITTDDRIRTWVDSSFLSDHAPIYLHLDSSFHKIAHPFKFNSGWLLESEFNSIVSDVWKDPLYLDEPCIQHQLIWKLKCIKARTKAWVATHKKHNSERLLQLESELQLLQQTDDRAGLFGNNNSSYKSS
jgi:hypothetical protein